tara:strand:- start:6674 stop:15043 length:8370 start_codon:yes stop_codon:yes gene_type:complete
MGCNKKRISDIEARLAEIAKLKAAIEARLQPNKEVDSSKIKIANAKYGNEIQNVEGRIRRAVRIQGDEIVPVKKNPNTINNVSDNLDQSNLNTPKVLPGDFVEIQFIENDYWANNKDKFEEPWIEAPLYIVDKEGNRLDLLESFKEHNVNTHIRKAIYEALTAKNPKKVELQVDSKIPNFNNIRIGGMPVFFNITEELKMTTLRDIDGNFITPTGEETRPILLVATGIGKTPRWNPGDLSYLNPKIQEAIIGDLGDPTRIPQPEHMGQIFSLTMTPEGKYSYVKLSTRNLSDKAYEYILNELSENRVENINQVVGNSTLFEVAHKDPNFLSIEEVPLNEGNVVFLNFYSPTHDKAIRIDSKEFNKGLNGEEFVYDVGRFVEESIDSPVPNFKWKTSKKIKSPKSKETSYLINEFLNTLKNKKHQINVDLLTSQEKFSIPGFTKPGGYNSYQEYLFDEEAHGDPYAYNIPIKNHGAILNTDLKNIEGSIYYNTHVIFNDVLIDGKSILTDPTIIPEGGLNPAISPNLGPPTAKTNPPNISAAPKIKPEDLDDLTVFSAERDARHSPRIDKEKAKQWLEDRFGKGSTTVLEGVNKIGNITRHGYFENMAFYLYQNAKIGTEFHEGFHGMFRIWMNDKQRESLYKEARKKYGIPTDKEIREINKIRKQFGQEKLSIKEAEKLVLEEKMAEEFSEYMLTDGQATPGGKIGKFFKNIWNFIKSLFKDSMTIKQAYEMLESNVVPVTFKRNIQRFRPDTANSIEGYSDANIKEVIDYLTARYRNTIQSYKDQNKKVPYKTLNNKVKNSVLREAFSTNEGLPIEGAEKLEVLREWYEKRDDKILFNNQIKKQSVRPIKGEPKTHMYPNQNNHEYLLNIYTNWNDIIDNSELENLRRVGFESLMQDGLVNYGLKLKLGEVILEEVEEGTAYERIYSRSRVEEDMRNKINSQIKEFLSTIPSGESSYLGYENYLPFDTVYKDIQSILADSTSFPIILNRLDIAGKTKPHIAEVVKRLRETTDNNLRAGFAFTFMQSKNNFFLAKETTEGLQFMNSNRNAVETRIIDQWRTNAVQHKGFPNERHLYSIRQVGDNLIYSTNKKRVSKLNTTFKSMNKIYNDNPSKPLPEKRIEDLINFLHILGVDITSSPQKSKELLTTYFNEGSTEFSKTGQKLKGVALYKNMLDNGTATEVSRLVKGVNKGENIYTTYRGILSKFSSIAMSGQVDLFTSFLNVKNNSIHPINMPTPMDDLILNLKGNNREFFEPFLKDVFYNPAEYNSKARSLWLTIYGGLAGNFSNEARANLTTEIFDGYVKFSGRSFDFGEMNEIQSAYIRLGAFMDRSGKRGYVKMFVPNLSDRSKLKAYTVPSIDTIKTKLNLSDKDIIKGLIIQDLMRYQQADLQTESVEEGGLPDNQLIPGFHYQESPRSKDGKAFQLLQLTPVENSAVFQTKIQYLLSDVDWKDYLSGDVMVINREAVNDALNNEVAKVIDALNERAKKNMAYYQSKGILDKLKKSVSNPYSSLEELFRQYEFNNMVHKIELQKFTRGGIAFNKSYTDFSKRFGNMETPGYKLLLKGDLKDPGYGFYRQFNEGLMEDFFTTPVVYEQIGDSITATLEAQGDINAEKIGNSYKRSNKSDAFGVVSIDFYKAFKEGKGEWQKEDEEAYQNYKNGRSGNKFFRDNSGRRRRLEPIKGYFDAMVEKNGMMMPQNTKNSYMVLTEEFTLNNPTAELIRQRLEGEGNFAELPTMHVLNTVSTKKLAYTGVENLNDTDQVLDRLTNMDVTTLPGSGFRIPQIIPEKTKDYGLLGRQFMLGIISNIDLNDPALNYIVNQNRINERALNGRQVFDLYHNTVSNMIDKSYKKLMNDLGYGDLVKAVGYEAQNTAQLNLLKNLRTRLIQEIKDRELAENYIKALEIEKTEKGNYRFKIPLAFPTLKRKFESIIMGMLKKDIVKQTINGGSAKQIAELGGHITWDQATGLPSSWTELKFIRNENGTIKHAEVAISEELAAQYGFKPGEDLSTMPEELRILIGYRIPTQGKNSMLPMIIKYILPRNYDQAIMVPAGITVQMGADFDIDTLQLMKPNTRKNPETGRQEKINVNYRNLFIGPEVDYSALEKLERPELENIIIDLAESILKSFAHFGEVVTPLDSPNLAFIANQVKETLGLKEEFDHNDSFSEIQLERMNKDGNSGIGIYANAATGKNIAVYSQLHLKAGLAPVIDGQEYNNLQSIFDDKTTSNRTRGEKSELIEYNISKRISSAVDNAKNPDMYFRNDNALTAPISILFDSLGINEYVTHDFLNQPVIRMLTRVYQDGEYTPNMLYEAVSETWNTYTSKYTVGQHIDMPFSEVSDFGFVEMSTEKLSNISEENIIHEDQLQYLSNFLSFHKTGRDLTSAYVLLNQDKGADQANFGGLLSYKSRKDVLVQNDLIGGLNSVLEGESYPLQKSYKQLIDKLLDFGSEFFIHNKRSVIKVKEQIRTLLNKDNLSDVDHRLIEEAILLEIMSKENSPLKSTVFTEDNIRNLLIRPKTNVLAKLQDLKAKFPRLEENMFIKNIIEHPENLKEDSILTRVKFQNINSFTKSETDLFSLGLKNLFLDSEAEIRELATDFIRISLLSHGFTPGHDSFIDIIPVEVLSNSSTYFYEQFELLDEIEYLGNNFAHDFIRNFYYTDVVNQIKVNKESVAANTIQLNKKDSRIYSKILNKTTDYFKVSSPQGTKLFVKVDEVGDNVLYKRSTTKGIPYGLKELNIYNSEGMRVDKSVIQGNQAGRENIQPGLAKYHEQRIDEIVEDNEDAKKRCVNIKSI